jgi:hypothetical protein
LNSSRSIENRAGIVILFVVRPIPLDASGVFRYLVGIFR